jgi:hypothetical protein
MVSNATLLRIFDFHLDDEDEIDAWHALVHVCRQWRNIVFGSARRLDLRLYCKVATPIWKTLKIWPPLPIVIRVFNERIRDMFNFFEALEHNDRMRELCLWRVSNSQLDRILSNMEQPFPELTDLTLEPGDDSALDIPASFLGGSAPRLRSLKSYHIRFLGLRNLLLSATHLVHLQLWKIPSSGYVSPEAIVTCLSALTKLEALFLGFEAYRSRSVQEGLHLPLQTRTLLPVLTELHFRGFNKYLEGLVARIDTPLLDHLDISFFHQPTFDTPQLTQFISRTPTFEAHDEERVVFSDRDASVTLPKTLDGKLEFKFLHG